MNEQPEPLLTQPALPSQTIPLAPPGPSSKEDAPRKAETGEEEPYTIKCICDFTDDDGNTIYCDTCDTWQHIDCFYPNNREEVSREDFAHSCAECNPRPLDRQNAKKRTLRLNPLASEDAVDKKPKRLQPRSHKKKPRPSDVLPNGAQGPLENGKHTIMAEQPPAKKPRPSHRSSQSMSSHNPKRSPSYNNSRSNNSHPLSPATTPPDLPDDFTIHQYSDRFYSLYNQEAVTETKNNTFARLDVASTVGRWPREPETMKREAGKTYSEVFQARPADIEDKKPVLKIQDATRQLNDNKTLKWRFVKSTAPIDKDVPLIELNGEIGFQNDYCADLANLWAELSSPLPFVFFHPMLPLCIDTRKEGSSARYVRRSCRPNVVLDTYLAEESNYHFWLVSDRHISENEQITLPWDFRLEKTVHDRWLHLLGLSDDDTQKHDEIEMDETEYVALTNWIDRILSEYGGCACDLDNNCAFARFHRRYLHGRSHGRSGQNKKKSRNRPRSQAISPTSTGQATNSRAASEGHGDERNDPEAKYESTSSRSKPPSRDPTPLRQGSFDHLGILTEPTDRDKRKVAMVEDSFRRLEQQPPKKKKRVSDGSLSNASKSKPRPTSQAKYVDASTSRSKSGSPATAQSPNTPIPPRATGARSESQSSPRPGATASRPNYCDASVQTEQVEGEWFSPNVRSPRPRKKIITLSQRLMKNKRRMQERQASRSQSITESLSGHATAEIVSPTAETTSAHPPNGTELLSPTSQSGGDAIMCEAPAVPSDTSASAPAAKKTPDLRVQMPPVPAFDSSAGILPSATTPLSASSSIAQSPFGMNSLSSPFALAATNGVVAQPSPAKKKLSLSDYKSRMNKAAGKVAGGTTVLKPTLSSPEETKVDVVTEITIPKDKVDESTPVVDSPKMNGA